jgi:hemoglobin/transferrin/lactoferrin receptor protein
VDAAGNDLGEQPLSKVPPSMIHVGARYEPAGSRAWVEGLVTAADEQDHLSQSDKGDPQRIPPGGTPGYTVYTLRGGYRVNSNLTLTASAENISGKDYRIHGSGQNEPGTNVILGMDLRF